MRHTSIPVEIGSQYVPLRPEFVEICGNACAALLLAHFDYWTAGRINEIEHARELGHAEHPHGLWLRATLPWVESGLFNAFGRAAIRTAIDLLIEKGFVLVRRHPSKKWDRAHFYRVDAAAVALALGEKTTGAWWVDDDLLEPDDAGAEPNDAGAKSNHVDAESNDHAGASEELQVEGKEKTPGVPDKIEQVWNHYVERIKPHMRGRTIPVEEKRIIRNALAAADLEECLAAIDGLSQSPHHNGVNDSNKKFLGIRYCLKGFKDGDTTRERIEKAMDWRQLGDGPEVFDDIRVKRLLDAVNYSLQTGGEIERGTAAKAKLIEMGFTVSKDPSGERAILRKVNTAA